MGTQVELLSCNLLIFLAEISMHKNSSVINSNAQMNACFKQPDRIFTLNMFKPKTIAIGRNSNNIRVLSLFMVSVHTPCLTRFDIDFQHKFDFSVSFSVSLCVCERECV